MHKIFAIKRIFLSFNDKNIELAAVVQFILAYLFILNCYFFEQTDRILMKMEYFNVKC